MHADKFASVLEAVSIKAVTTKGIYQYKAIEGKCRIEEF